VGALALRRCPASLGEREREREEREGRGGVAERGRVGVRAEKSRLDVQTPTETVWAFVPLQLGSCTSSQRPLDNGHLRP
jgi:hypothetical protein